MLFLWLSITGGAVFYRPQLLVQFLLVTVFQSSFLPEPNPTNGSNGLDWVEFISAREHNAERAICYRRPSVCPSVRLSHAWISQNG